MLKGSKCWSFTAVMPFRHPPTAEKGFLSLFSGGSASAAPPPPTHRWKGIFIPFWWWVRLRRASAPHPPLERETPHIWGVSLVHGGQRPISLEYQIIHPPKVHNTSDTLVTGMSQSRLGDSFRQCYLHLRWLYLLLHEFRSQMCHAEEYSRTGNRELNMIRNMWHTTKPDIYVTTYL